MTQIFTDDVTTRQTPVKPIKNPLPIAKHTATSIQETFNYLKTDQFGLDPNQVSLRQRKYAANEIGKTRSPRASRLLIQAIHNPFIYILAGLTFLSFFLDYLIPKIQGEETELMGIFIMSTMIILSVGVRFFQEFRSNKITESLNALVNNHCQVLRKDLSGVASYTRIPHQQLVPGDIVRLSVGDIVPADIRLMSSNLLQINQSVLTGESHPVEKVARQNSRDDLLALTESQLAQQTSICLMSTSVVGGSACGIVIATGEKTWFGSLASSLSGISDKTAFDHGVNKVSWLLIRFMACMVPLVFLFNGLTKGEWLDSLFFALAIAVGLTPEMLPMIVTTNLVRGAKKMAEKKVIVRRLSAIQNLGAMEVLCIDKTGTLTEDQIMMSQTLNCLGEPSMSVAEIAWINSSLQIGYNSPMDHAIKLFAERHNLLDRDLAYSKIAELPFDFNRRCLSVAVNYQDEKLLITKGAADEMLSRCNYLIINGKKDLLDEKWRNQLNKQIDQQYQQGFRVLLLAYKTLKTTDLEDNETLHADCEQQLNLLGFLLFVDPVKHSARDSLQNLQQHGITVKILTGDVPEAAKKVCREVGLTIDKVLLGSEVEQMDDELLSRKINQHQLFARLTPKDKVRIVTLLKKQGKTTGFLGDGVNDAAAIQASDIGLTVENASDVARQAADMLLLEKDLNVIVDGVRQGRHTFANIIKYLNITASSNFGNVFTVLIASLFIPFIPMMAIQLLLLNLIYDISQLALPWDRVDEEQVRKPGQWDSDNIGRVMLVMGPISSIFDVATFAVMWLVFSANSEASQALFHTGWFVESLLSQTLVVHLLRTAKVPFLQSVASWPLTVSTLLVILIGVVLPYSPFAAYLGLTALPSSYFIWLALILGGYCLLSQQVKKFYCKRFGRWF